MTSSLHHGTVLAPMNFEECNFYQSMMSLSNRGSGCLVSKSRNCHGAACSVTVALYLTDLDK